jgi:hypothetical protein
MVDRGVFVSLLVLFSLLALPCAGTADTWSRTYDAPGGQGAWEVLEASDGTLLVGGQSDRNWVLHLDAAGDVVFDQTWSISVPQGLASPPDEVAFAPDGSALLAGRDVVDIFWIQHGWVAKVDRAGDVQWAARFYGEPFPSGWGRYFFAGLAHTSDGGAIASGQTALTDAGPHYAWVVKLDAAGAVEWRQKFAGGPEDGADVVQTSDGGYALAGRTGSGSGLGDVWVVRLNATGGIVWEKTLGGTDLEEATAIVELSDGGFALSGWTNSFTASGHAPWAIRLDASGNVVWQVAFGSQEWGDFQDVVVTSDGELLFTGRVWAPGWDTNELWIVKMRASDGEVLWQRAYEGPSGDYGESAALLSDGGFLVGGTWGWGMAEERMWLLRLTGSGTVPGCDLMADTTVPPASPRIDEGGGIPPLEPVDGGVGGVAFVTGAVAPTLETQCLGPPCEPPSCDGILVEPDLQVCVGDAQTLTALFSGGEGAVTVEWDLDGDTVHETPGNPVAHAFPEGDTNAGVLVTDSCADPGPQDCSDAVLVTAHPNPTPIILPEGPTTFCAQLGQSVLLDAGTGFAAYQWAVDGGDIGGAVGSTYDASASGSYTVTVTDGNGCVGTSPPVAVDADDCPCATLECTDLTVAPDPVCEGEEQTFTLTTSGGEGAVTVEWDLDGDTMPDATGNPLVQALAEGDWLVAATATDSCADPAPQQCATSVPATVLSAAPPAEVSEAGSGAPPLLVRKLPDRLVVEGLPGAAAYNAYADLLGSWYAPARATGTDCPIEAWTDNGDGTITLDVPLPAGSWFVVTASTECAEGPAGESSGGTERMAVGTWEDCLP